MPLTSLNDLVWGSIQLVPSNGSLKEIWIAVDVFQQFLSDAHATHDVFCLKFWHELRCQTLHPKILWKILCHWLSNIPTSTLSSVIGMLWCPARTMFVRQSTWRVEAHFLQPLFTFKVGLCTPIPSGSPYKLQPFCKILKPQNTYPVMDKLLKFHTYYYIDNTHPKIFPWLSISILVPPTHQWLWSAWMPISHSSFILKKKPSIG